MQKLQKRYAVFIPASAAFWAAVLFGELFLVRGEFPKSVSTALFAAAFAVWGVMAVRFHSYKYRISGGELLLFSGIFVKKVKKLRAEDILLRESVKFGNIFLFARLKTAGGSAIVFFNPENCEFF